MCGTVLDGLDERHSPWRRVTVWCPGCQPLEPAREVDLPRARKLLGWEPKVGRDEGLARTMDYFKRRLGK